MPNPTDLSIPYIGRELTIFYAAMKSERTPAKKFLEGLDKPQRAKFWAIIVTLADNGSDGVSGEQLKHLDDDIWEMRVLKPGYRLLCFPHGSDWYLTHGCEKLGQKEFQAQILKAKNIRQEYLANARRR